MKTIGKVIFAITFLMGANYLFGAGNLKVNILPVSTDKALFAVSSLCQGNFVMTVTDSKGKIVYYNKNEGPEIEHLEEFDMYYLDHGNYKLTVVSENITTERQFSISEDDVRIGKERTMIQPFFGYKSGLLRCTYLNFPKENLTIYFLKNNQLLYSKELGKTFNVCEGLNLSKLEKGNYEVILSAGIREYAFRVDKE
jgi:hypothetical protein